MKKRALLLVTLLLAATLLLSGCDALLSALQSAAVQAAQETGAPAPSLAALPLYEAPADEKTPRPDADAKPTPTPAATPAATAAEAALDEDGSYTSRDDVALYLHLYGRLPENFITKKEAQALGWPGGSLEKYAPGKSIGGDRFGNYEGLLPEKQGRGYTECDIDTRGAKSRGAKRIVFSNDGLIYYTDDHYESFTLLYGDENG